MFIGLLHTLTPSDGFLPLFREVLRDVWTIKNNQRENLLTQARQRISDLEGRQQKLVDAVVDGRISKETYDNQSLVVGTDLEAAKIRESEALIGAAQIERLLEFAEWLLEPILVT